MNKDIWLKNTPIAHRGLWTDEIPENSFLAFEKAINNNHPIELDVQMTSDGELVIFHDWMLNRMTNVNEKISKMSSNRIEKLHLKNTKQKIPFFKDLLNFVNGRVPLLIEMKNRDHKKYAYIKKLFCELEKYDGDFALSSFDPFLVKSAKKKFPHILCGQNFYDYIEYGVIYGWVRKMVMYGYWLVSRHMPDFFVCRASMLPVCWVRSVAVKKQRYFLVWSICSQKEYCEKKDLIDNYIFDKKYFLHSCEANCEK